MMGYNCFYFIFLPKMFDQLIKHNHDQSSMEKITFQKTKDYDSQFSAQDNDQEETIFWNAQFPNFQFLKQLAATDCSLVWLVKDTRNDTICVAKILQKVQVQGSRKNHQNCQIQFLKKYKLNLGVNILQIQQSEQFYLILMQNCCGGSLEYYISHFTSNQRKYSKQHLNWVKNCMVQIIQGLKEIHSLNYVHRDLKPSNILVSHEGRLKISDFGFIQKQNQIDSSLCGTPFYMPPEVLGNPNKKKVVAKSIDIWGLGAILYQLLTGNVPFQGDSNQQIIESIYSGYIQLDIKMPQSAKNLIKDIMQISPQKRINLVQITNHLFFKQEF